MVHAEATPLRRCGSARVNGAYGGCSRPPGLARIRHRKCHRAKSADFNPGPGRPVRCVLGSGDDAWAAPPKRHQAGGKSLICWD